MSTTVSFGGITTVRTGILSTYVLSLHSWGSGATFYKIGRTRNLPNRISTLLSAFNSGQPRGYQGFPSELVGPCPLDAVYGACPDGDDCEDKRYELALLAHIEGDHEAELHRRFAHLRLDPSWLHRDVGGAEWFFPCHPDEPEYPASIDAWLGRSVAA